MHHRQYTLFRYDAVFFVSGRQQICTKLIKIASIVNSCVLCYTVGLPISYKLKLVIEYSGKYGKIALVSTKNYTY